MINKYIFDDYISGVQQFNSHIIPNNIFKSGWSNNAWYHNGKGRYFNLYATGSKGATIFWNIKK